MKNIIENTTEFSSNLRRTYNWFSDAFVNRVEQACLDFFGIDNVAVKLFALSENENIYIKGSRYFVTKVGITKNLNVSIRVSQEIVGYMLDNALGNAARPFVLENLSELEANVITEFNNYLFKSINKVLVQKEQIDKHTKAVSECIMVFCLAFRNGDFGKLVLSIPTNLILPKEIEQPAEETFTIDYFRHSHVGLRIRVGSSKLTLGEVKSIRKDDLLLLEDSDIYKMTICNGKDRFTFRLNPDPSIIMDTDDDEDELMGENSGSKNMWDSIQVDIVAEFERVKITLGELKQISEGLVVDIGSIYDNKVDLRVENKIVARGELVILNDRYGVRIDEVLKEEEDQEEVIEEDNTVTEERSEESSEGYEDEDFNYDDFDEDNEI